MTRLFRQSKKGKQINIELLVELFSLIIKNELKQNQMLYEKQNQIIKRFFA